MPKMTNNGLKQLIAELAAQTTQVAKEQAETQRQIRATDAQLKATAAEVKATAAEVKATAAELSASGKRTDAQIKETNRQLGRLGNMQGRYTEGLVYPSIERILFEEFKMNVVAQRVRSSRRDLEIDVLGYSNGDVGEAYVVEVKSSLGADEIKQTLGTLAEFRKAFPEHANKTVYGIVAAVDIPENMRNRVLKAGLYLARISNDTFHLAVPSGFKPKAF